MWKDHTCALFESIVGLGDENPRPTLRIHHAERMAILCIGTVCEQKMDSSKDAHAFFDTPPIGLWDTPPSLTTKLSCQLNRHGQALSCLSWGPWIHKPHSMASHGV